MPVCEYVTFLMAIALHSWLDTVCLACQVVNTPLGVYTVKKGVLTCMFKYSTPWVHRYMYYQTFITKKHNITGIASTQAHTAGKTK